MDQTELLELIERSKQGERTTLDMLLTEQDKLIAADCR